MTVFQRQNNVSLLTINQRRNLTLKKRSFSLDTKTNFLSGRVLFHSNYGLTACNFAKRFAQVRFLGISRINALQRYLNPVKYLR